MGRLFVSVLLGSFAMAQIQAAKAQSGQVVDPQPALKQEDALADLPALPPAPQGKSTILGGAIRSVDSVRDQITLQVPGQRALKILFDERTEVYRDGKRIPLRELGPTDHASIQTLLDGTNVFALGIHMLSQSPEGEYQGQVLGYDSASRELTVSDTMVRDHVKLFVPASTPIVREGQPDFSSVHPGASDLVNGTLVSIKFKSEKPGRGVASQITVLATPGSTFVFEGNVSALDMHSGLLALSDPRDERSYQIYLDSSGLAASQNLHEGDHVRVTAHFNGTRYVASAVTID